MANDTLPAFPAFNEDHPDRDAPRELSRAVKRIAALEAALSEIADGHCDAPRATLLGSCKCCLHDRAIAKAALAGIT